MGAEKIMGYAGTYRGTIHTYCSEFDYTDQITFTIDKNGVIDLPHSSQGTLHDGNINSSGGMSGISITVRSQSLGTITIPYSGTNDGKSFSVSGRSSNGIISTIQATRVIVKYTAVSDTASVTEDDGYAARGNVLDNDTDDSAVVSAVKGRAVGASGNTKIVGNYGTLTIAASGAYSYEVNDANAKVDALKDGQRLSDKFVYTASNGDNASSATLSVTIYGQTDQPKPVYGTNRADILNGSAVAEAFHGDLGTDTVSYARAKAAVTANLVSPAGSKGDAAGDVFYSIENLKGSAFADLLRGNSGNNLLDGGAGADKLYGGAGDDTYVVDSTSDVVVEGGNAGTDTIKSSVTIKSLAANVEKLVLTGKANLDATGNSLANTITGNSGSNTIDGGAGKDVLIGGAGKDTFLFKNTPGAANLDHIKDFSPADDTIALGKGVFAGLKAGTLSSSAFKDITDGAALDADDRILYNHDTGVVSFDADGSGTRTAVAFLVLDTHPTLTFQDFQVV